MANQVGTRGGVRAGFTLVELLIVAMVVAILATITIGAYTNSMELGKEARTRAQIAKINALLALDWEKYRTRRVKVEGAADRQGVAQERLDVLRQLMRLEFPDRKSDVIGNGVAEVDLPARAKWYQDEAERLESASGQQWSTTYQQSECLFLIVASSQDRDTNGLEFFRPTEIGDLDGDGMKELLDGWGNPIRFLRWAPGFISDKQQAYRVTSESGGGGSTKVVSVSFNQEWVNDNPDPFDPLRIDEETGGNEVTFYLYPLVISAGSDGIFDVRFSVEGTKDYTNPYHAVKKDGTSAVLGSYQDQGELLGDNAESNGTRNDGDNVHNHFVSVRVR